MKRKKSGKMKLDKQRDALIALVDGFEWASVRNILTAEDEREELDPVKALQDMISLASEARAKALKIVKIVLRGEHWCGDDLMDRVKAALEAGKPLRLDAYEAG